MNLKEIRNQIFNVTDYAPELATFKNQVDALIEDAYQRIYSSKRWSFAEQEALFPLHPDMLPTRDHRTAGSVVSCSVVTNERGVTFSSTMERLGASWEGQPIEIQGYEYIISEVTSSTTLTLDRPFLGTTETADVSWKIKHRYYKLPSDCVEVLSIGQRDVPAVGATTWWSKMQAIPASSDEAYRLEVDRTSDHAEAYIPTSPVSVPPGEKIDLDVERLEGTTVDTFTNNSYIEVCWAFEEEGVIGGLSEPATYHFQIPDVGPRISGLEVKCLSWDDQEIKTEGYNLFDRAASPYEGKRKVFFWNANYNRTTGKRLGRPCWKEIVTGGDRDTTTFLKPLRAPSTASSIVIKSFDQCSSGNARYMEMDGQHLRIRPYPRPDSWNASTEYEPAKPGNTNPAIPTRYVNDAILRYYKKPIALTLDTDVPDMPYEFHQLIVFAVLEDLYMKLGQTNMAGVYNKRSVEAMKDLQKRYVSRTDNVLVKGSNWSAGRRSQNRMSGGFITWLG